MSDLDADVDAPRGRSTTIAVVLAVVFLAVLGASVGVIVGTQDGRNRTGNVAGGETPTPSTGATDDPAATPTEPGKTGGTRPGTATHSTRATYPPTRKDDCPKQSDDAAGGIDLDVVLYIRTSRSEAWICQGQGRTFYQGHNRNKPFPSGTSDNSIFLTNVRYEGGVHAATNGSTVYYVSTERLRIERDGKETANEAVEEYYEG